MRQREISPGSVPICHVYVVHPAFCSLENGIALLRFGMASCRYRIDDGGILNDTIYKRKVGFWHVYAPRISRPWRINSTLTGLSVRALNNRPYPLLTIP